MAQSRSKIAGYLWAIIAVAAMTALGWPLAHKLDISNESILMLYLLAVLWVATRYNRGAAVVASLLGVAAFDFIFVPPYYTLAVSDPQRHIVTFAVMLTTALVISALTYRVRQQADESKAAWELVEAEFLRNTLLSGVSHELRTPLSVIAGSAGAIVEAGDNLPAETRKEMLQTITEESERMDRLINNLLDMTRLESGGLMLKREWQPIQEVIGSALRHLDRRLAGREVKIDIAGNTPLVMIDSIAIEQVLTNLIDNAVEYTQSAIEVSARPADGGLSVTVADRGPGLAPGTESRVFQKFFRIRPAENSRGIGLGLAIARGIVEAHGGTISARNRDGGGAVFEFTIPVTGSPPRMDAVE